MPDNELLDRAGQLGRVLFTRDRDFLVEAAARHRRGESFAGVVYAYQMRVSIGECVRDLELLAKCSEPADFVNRVERLPLR